MSLTYAETSSIPAWQRDAADHLWMPYTQMQTAPLPLPVVATEDVYLVLSDGRRLIDGLASWWTPLATATTIRDIAQRVAAHVGAVGCRM